MTYQPFFSHIYIEKNARNYPLTEKLLKEYKTAQVVAIDSYKNIFNRYNQDWNNQKKSQKLILAVKKDNLLFEGSDYCPDFDYKNFCYCTQIINCPYNCEYCYLQGKYPSANIVVFVNENDFHNSAINKVDEAGSLFLCVSYESDLLFFENILNFIEGWYNLALKEKRLTIECRTKTANTSFTSNHKSIDNMILAWTLSPQEIIDEFETGTPSLNKRINAIKNAMNHGWNVRICIDPVITIGQWQNQYKDLIKKIKNEISNYNQEISLGTFRMNSEYFKIIKKKHPLSKLYAQGNNHFLGDVKSTIL